MTLAPLTRLDAVNTMLSAIGESPVNSLGDTGVADADLAERILKEVSAEVQAIGLQCNSDYNWSLSPNTDGIITVPSNAIRVDVDPNYSSASLDVTVRGGRLYNKKDHTYVWTSPVVCEVIWLLEFEDLPESVRRYITVRSARKLQDRAIGHEATHQFNEADELAARALLMESEFDTGDHTVFDNYDTFRTIDR